MFGSAVPCRRLTSKALISSKHVFSTARSAPPPVSLRLRLYKTFSTTERPFQQKQSNADSSKAYIEPAVPHLPKRKAGGRSPKTSLRSVAVEAEISRDRRSRQVGSEIPLETKTVTAYCVAEQFDLSKALNILRAKGYKPDPCDTGLASQVVHIQVPSSHDNHNSSPTDEVGDLFIFRSGTVVSWGLPNEFSSSFAIETLLPAAKNAHVNKIESEDLEYIEDPTKSWSGVKGDTIILGTKIQTEGQVPAGSAQNDASLESRSEESRLLSDVDTVLGKIAFSSGLARSTRLAVLETLLDNYFQATKSIPTVMAGGSRLPFTRRFILKKTGQLLGIRAQLNLYSELTDSLPDLFWDSRHELGLENYYDQVGRALDINVRIKLLNEKMDYAQEIASVLRERLSERHGLVLEWTIIILIAVEVFFELMRQWRERNERLDKEIRRKTEV